MWSYRVNDWNDGLYKACYGSHLELAELMINPFPTDEIAKSNVNPSSIVGIVDYMELVMADIQN